jgi:hypothetical protein
LISIALFALLIEEHAEIAAAHAETVRGLSFFTPPAKTVAEILKDKLGKTKMQRSNPVRPHGKRS